MKRLLVLFLSFLLLAGCGSRPVQPEPSAEAAFPSPFAETTADEPETPTEPSNASSPEAPAETEAAPQTPAAPLPYTLQLYGCLSIFDAPSFDGRYVRSVGQNGIYTITEEQADEEGNLWGRLKSGVGWVCLSEQAAEIPLLAGLSDASILDAPHHFIHVDDSAFSEYVVFQPNSALTDVIFSALLPDAEGYIAESLCDRIPELTPEKPLIAQVVFYGDFTTYGLSFCDETGIQRYLALYISGRNGAPVLQEYIP